MKRVDFFYDFSCPYAYLAHTQIEALCGRAGAELAWKPFLLGGVFKAIGTPPVPFLGLPAAKARHNALDMMRWADHWGVPLHMPAFHPLNARGLRADEPRCAPEPPPRTVLALRAALASGDLPRASKALYAAYWVDGRDVSSPEVVREALDGAGLDGAALVARAEEPAIKDELRRRTDEAIAAGVFGAPAFVVKTPSIAPGGALFWGQDRLHWVEQALGGWTPPDARGSVPEVKP